MKKVYGTYVLSLLSGLILVYVILTVNLLLISPNSEWGFAGQMPLTYWIGFILFLTSFGFLVWHDGSKPSSTQCLLWLLLLIGYWNVYIFVQPAPLRPDAYLHFADVFRLSEGGRITDVRYGMGGWPGLFILQHIVLSVTGAPAMFLLKFYPLLSSSTLVFATFLVAKRVFGSSLYGVIVATLALFGNIGLQFTFTPHSFVAALIPLMFLIFYIKGLNDFIVVIVVYSGIVITYGLFPLYFAAVMLSVEILGHLFGERERYLFSGRQKTFANLTMLIVTLALAYMNFEAEYGIERGAFTLKTILERAPSAATYQQMLSSRLVFPMLASLRSGLLFIYMVGGISVSIYLLWTIFKHRNNEFAFLIVINGWSILLWLASPYLTRSLPGTRVWYLIVVSSSLSAPILISRIARIRRDVHFHIKFLSVVLIVFLGMTGFIAFHAHDAYLAPPISELDANRFIAEHWNGSIIIDGGYPTLPIEFYKPEGSFTHKPFFTLGNITLLDSSKILVTKHTSYSAYFLLGKTEEYNRLQTYLHSAVGINKIYSSRTLEVFTGSHAP